MSLYELSGLEASDLARRLNMDAVEDETGLTDAIKSSCSEIELHVQTYSETIPVPDGLKTAILDVAANRYQHASISSSVRMGAIQYNYDDEYARLFQRLAPWRKWAGL